MLKIEGLLEVKDCPHGRGVFSCKDLQQGELIWSFADISITAAPRSPPWKRWALIIGKADDGQTLFWDEASENSDEYWSNFLDHNRQPNVRFLIEVEKRTARLVAVRALKAGQELFLDYKEYDPGNWTPASETS